MNNNNIAISYSRALFSIAKENNNINDIFIELNQFKDIVKKQPQFINLITSPNINKKVKDDIINLLKKNSLPIVSNLLQMVYDRNHFDILVDIIENFNNIYDAYHKIVHIEVITVSKLNDIQRKNLENTFVNNLGANQVIIKEIIDPKLIGGIIIKYNNCVYDGSIKSKLSNMKYMLA